MSSPGSRYSPGRTGRGKSTAYDRFLAAGLRSGEYLNPDDIARELRTRSAGSGGADLTAGREVIRRTRSLIAARQPFVRETTLSGREIERSVVAAKTAGYRIAMVYVAVSSLDMTGWRIVVRAATGGHDIAPEDQARRQPRSFANAPRMAGLANVSYFLDNAGHQHRLVATVEDGVVTFLDPQGALWVEQATAGLSQAGRLMTRDQALEHLRITEGLSNDLEVREEPAEYTGQFSGLDTYNANVG